LQELAHQTFISFGQLFLRCFLSSAENTQMPKLIDTCLQAQLLEEAQKLHEKLARLKASLCAADALCDQRINMAALREIDHYRAKHLAAHEGRDDTTAMGAPLPTSEN
jgi:hypothetical protein